MKSYNVLKLLSIIFYCLIILRGDMIGIPFIFYLIFSFGLGSLTGLSALLAFAGLIFTVTLIRKQKTKRILLFEIIILILLLSPLIERTTSIPISLFNYGAFIIPTASFIVLYILSLLFSYKTFLSNKHRISNIVRHT